MAEDEESATSKKVAAPVDDSELQRAYLVPAENINRMIAQNLSNGMRIAFAEAQFPRVEAQFRSAIFLSFEDAEGLAQLILRQLSLLRSIEAKVGSDGKPVSE